MNCQRWCGWYARYERLENSSPVKIKTFKQKKLALLFLVYVIVNFRLRLANKKYINMIFFCLETLSSIMKLVVFPNGLKSQWHIPADAFLNICNIEWRGNVASHRCFWEPGNDRNCFKLQSQLYWFRNIVVYCLRFRTFV